MIEADGSLSAAAITTEKTQGWVGLFRGRLAIAAMLRGNKPCVCGWESILPGKDSRADARARRSGLAGIPRTIVAASNLRPRRWAGHVIHGSPAARASLRATTDCGSSGRRMRVRRCTTFAISCNRFASIL